MLKIITPGSFRFDEPAMQMVKMSSRGLRGNDLHAFVKRAGHQFADALNHIQLAPGEEPVHLLAVGATERYGPNRNADGFDRSDCVSHHGTFQKYARWYRNHQNKDPKKGRGIVKLSMFNPVMDRIELLVALNATKEAADRNGGLIADEEMQKLAAGKDIPVSMACKVAHDVCSGCGQQAKTRKEYCNDDMCKYGGCAGHLGDVFEDGHILHRRNPNPVFFDISNVVRPADRIAYTLGRLEKAASVGTCVSGADLAEMVGLTAPYEILGTATVDGLMKIAADAASMEDGINESVSHNTALAMALASEACDPLRTVPDVRSVTPTKLAHLVRALADENVILPLEEFLFVVNGGDREKAASAAPSAAAYLPGVFGDLIRSGDAESADANPYAKSAGYPPEEYRSWARKVACDYSMTARHIEKRAQIARLRGANPKIATGNLEKRAFDGGSAAQLARHYALYKLASLKHVAEHGREYPLALVMAILQNQILTQG